MAAIPLGILSAVTVHVSQGHQDIFKSAFVYDLAYKSLPSTLVT